MKDFLNKTKNMDLESLNGLEEIFLKDFFQMIKEMELDK